MALVTKTVQVNGDVDAVMQHLVKFVATTKALAKGGFQFLEIPQELNAIVAELVPAIAAFPTVAAEASVTDPTFRKAVELGADDVVTALLS